MSRRLTDELAVSGKLILRVVYSIYSNLRECMFLPHPAPCPHQSEVPLKVSQCQTEHHKRILYLHDLNSCITNATHGLGEVCALFGLLVLQMERTSCSVRGRANIPSPSCCGLVYSPHGPNGGAGSRYTHRCPAPELMLVISDRDTRYTCTRVRSPSLRRSRKSENPPSSSVHSLSTFSSLYFCRRSPASPSNPSFNTSRSSRKWRRPARSGMTSMRYVPSFFGPPHGFTFTHAHASTPSTSAAAC